MNPQDGEPAAPADTPMLSGATPLPYHLRLLALVAELADALHSKCSVFGRVGSSPTQGTIMTPPVEIDRRGLLLPGDQNEWLLRVCNESRSGHTSIEAHLLRREDYNLSARSCKCLTFRLKSSGELLEPLLCTLISSNSPRAELLDLIASRAVTTENERIY